MSLVLAGLLLATARGAIAARRWYVRRRQQVGSGESEATLPSESNAESYEMPRVDRHAASGDRGTHLEGFPCRLGDVVLRLSGEEAWLAGALVFSETRPIAALFIAPDATYDRALYVRPKPREALCWMAPLDPGAVLVGGEPPSVVEHAGVRYARVRRLPVRVGRIGACTLELGDSLILAEYASAGDGRLLVLIGASGASRAYRGEELDAHAYEVIASGSSTLGGSDMSVR